MDINITGLKKINAIFSLLFLLIILSSCNIDDETDIELDSNENLLEDPEVEEVLDGNAGYIADHLIAKESVLRSIPESYINLARTNLHIAYQHTSHGTHVSRGLFGLQEYKTDDEALYSITGNGVSVQGKLDFNDCYVGSNDLSAYSESGSDASDLSRNEIAFIQATRNFLDDVNNSQTNVIIWSWCNIAGHDVSENYLPGMATLISEYGVNGSKDRAAITPVTFVFMTGHANANDNVGDGKPESQAKLITDFCKINNQYCIDYYGIDTHDMEDNYWTDAGDNGQSSAYGGNFYQDWQDSHVEGSDWFITKDSPAGSDAYGAHNTQFITANRKAYATWWVLARISGWNGN